MFRMLVVLFLVLFFGSSTLAISATQGRESLPILSDFPFQCNGPFKGKKLSKEIIFKVVGAHKKWLINSKDPEGHQANLCGANLVQGNFQGMNLTSAVFKMAMLAGAKFSGATLNKAQFQGANLSGANFNNAKLEEANLDYAMLHLAVLRQTNLRKASLRHAMLAQANVQDAVLSETNLQDVDLRTVVKLTQSQVSQLCIHGNTKLPKGLIPPIPCNGQNGGLALKKTPPPPPPNLRNQTRGPKNITKGPQPDRPPSQKAPSTTPLNKTLPPQRELIAPQSGRTKFRLGLIAPPAGITLSGPTETFTWSTAPDVQEFFLHIGTSLGPPNHPLTKNIFNGVMPATQQSVTVQQLPMDGSDVYVRFWYKKANTWIANDQLHFKAFLSASGLKPNGNTTLRPGLIAPPAGSTLSGPTEIFTWSTAPDVQEFFLHIGTSLGPPNHPLTKNIFNGVMPATQKAVTVQQLPTDGSEVYVRLWYKQANTWTANDQLPFKAFLPSNGISPF